MFELLDTFDTELLYEIFCCELILKLLKSYAVLCEKLMKTLKSKT